MFGIQQSNVAVYRESAATGGDTAGGEQIDLDIRVGDECALRGGPDPVIEDPFTNQTQIGGALVAENDLT
jgi:hypothetical protein